LPVEGRKGVTAKKPDAVSPVVATLYRAVRAVLEALSRRRMAESGRGFDVTNLRKMRQFYRMFEIPDALRLESSKPKRDAVRRAFAANTARHAVCDELSWSRDRLLMQVENPASREWYKHETADQQWSTRRIERELWLIDARHVGEGKR
jgi:hypothetical protein